jgi:hypothetical protein
MLAIALTILEFALTTTVFGPVAGLVFAVATPSGLDLVHGRLQLAHFDPPR